jgi:hypothetical protein
LVCRWFLPLFLTVFPAESLESLALFCRSVCVYTSSVCSFWY